MNLGPWTCNLHLHEHVDSWLRSLQREAGRGSSIFYPKRFAATQRRIDAMPDSDFEVINGPCYHRRSAASCHNFPKVREGRARPPGGHGELLLLQAATSTGGSVLDLLPGLSQLIKTRVGRKSGSWVREKSGMPPGTGALQCSMCSTTKNKLSNSLLCQSVLRQKCS